MFSFGKSKRIYLDFAAATPMSDRVKKAVAPYLSEDFGNPSAIHEEGRAARKAVEDARAKVAKILAIRAQDVIFTSGGTESNNIALFGVITRLRKEGRAPENLEIITTAIEHPSVEEVARSFERRGVSVHRIGVSEDGHLDLEALKSALSHKTALISISYVNSEIGVIERVKKITQAVRAHREKNSTALPYVHLDASQAPLYLPLRMDSLGVDLMSLDAAKCYGPKGIGVLAFRNNMPIAAHSFGGGQERGLRPGTEPVPLIVGCAEAIAAAQESHEDRAQKVSELRDYFIVQIEKNFPDARINGSRDERIANNVSVSIPGMDGEYAVVVLDKEGIAASTMSACKGSGGGGSDVIRALGKDESHVFGTIRFTLGETTTKSDIDTTIEVLARHRKGILKGT